MVTNLKLDCCSLSNSLNLFSTEMSGPQFITEMFADKQSGEFVCGCWNLKGRGENEKRQDSVILVLKKLFT